MTHSSLPKPKHLERNYAEQFSDAAVVNVYHHRPPYPEEVFTQLCNLLVAGESRVVLDLGCGIGDIARPLADCVDAVDAVDCSAGMIARAQVLSKANITWIVGDAEDVALPHSTYGLVTAGESLHWMDWFRLFPRLVRLLPPDGFLALVGRSELPTPWWDDLLPLIQQYTTNRDYASYDLVSELETRNLFEQCGTMRTPPHRFSQSPDSYIESIHSRNGFSRDRMTRQAAEEFDLAARRLIVTRFPGGSVEFDVVGRVVWGRPLPGA